MIISLTKSLAIFGNVLLTGKKNVVGQVDPKLVVANGSITRLVDETIIEPTFVVTRKASESASYENLIGLQLNMFASLYSNAYLKLVEQEGYKVKDALTILSSNIRAGTTFGKFASKVGNQSDEFSEMETVHMANLLFNDIEDIRVSNEASITNRDGKPDKEPDMLNKHLMLTASVKDKDGGSREIKVPIIVRAAVYIVETEEMLNYASITTDKINFFNRTQKYLSGGISRDDYIFSTDLIKEDRERKFGNNKSTIIKRLEERKTNSIGVHAKSPIGLGRDYGIIIIDSSEQSELELVIRGSLRDSGVKDKFLYRTASNNLAVISEGYERVMFYTSNFTGVSRLGFDKLKKKDDSDKMKTMFETLIKSSNSL